MFIRWLLSSLSPSLSLSGGSLSAQHIPVCGGIQWLCHLRPLLLQRRGDAMDAGGWL